MEATNSALLCQDWLGGCTVGLLPTPCGGSDSVRLLKSLGIKLGGQARRVLEKFIDMWDHTNEDNLDYEEATSNEAIRDV